MARSSATTIFPSRGSAARAFIGAAAASCVATAIAWAQPLLMRDLALHHGMNEAAAGLVVTVEILASAIASVLATRFIPRPRARAAALAGIVLAVVASFATLRTTSPALLLGLRALVGLGLGAAVLVVNLVAAAFADSDKIYARFGLLNLAFGAGYVKVYSWTVARDPGITPYHVLFWAMLLAVPLVALLPSADALGAPPAPSQVSAARGTGVRTLLLAAVMVVVVLSSGIVWSLYAVIGAQAGLAPSEVEQAIAVSIVTACVAIALVAVIGHRLGRIVPFSLGLVVLSGAILVLTLSPGPTAYRVAVCANVAAIYFLVPYLTGAATAIDGVGRAATYVTGAFFFANAGGAVIGGLLVTTVGIHLLGVIVALVAALTGIAFVYVERLNTRRGAVLPLGMMDQLSQNQTAAVGGRFGG